MDKMKVALIGLGAGVLVGAGVGIWSWRKKRKAEVEKTPIDGDERDRIAKEAVRKIIENRGYAVESSDDVPVGETDIGAYKVVPDDGKPDIRAIHIVSRYIRPVADVREEEKPEEKPEEKEEEKGGDVIVEPPIPAPMTRFGTPTIHFNDAGVPLFDKGEWLSEIDNIVPLTKEEYDGDGEYYDFEKDDAVWFPNAGVMLDGEMVPLDVVDCVGCAAFTKLVAHPDRELYVANLELKRRFALGVNDELSYEEVLEEMAECGPGGVYGDVVDDILDDDVFDPYDLEE